MRVKRLTRVCRARPCGRAGKVLALTNQGVPSHGGLYANLVALTRVQPHLDECGISERLEHLVFAYRLNALRIPRICHRLPHRIGIPREAIAPRPARRTRSAVNDRPVHALRLASRELVLDGLLCRRGLREDDDARCVAIDAMDDERRPVPTGTEMVGEQTEYRSRSATSKRHCKESGWLVHDEQRLVLIKNAEAARLESGFAATAARPVEPDPHGVTRCDPSSRVTQGRLGVVEKHLSAFQRRTDATARAEPTRGSEIPIEPKPLFFRCDSPLSARCLHNERLDPSRAVRSELTAPRLLSGKA